MGLGFGLSLAKSGLITPGIVTDNLVLKHNYNANGNIPVSDGAAFFNGTADYIQIAEKFENNLFTVSAWINMAAVDTESQAIFSNRGSSSEGFMCYLNSNERPTIKFEGTPITGNTVLSVNKWYHLAWTYDNTTLKIYIDGVLDNSGTHTSSDIAGTANARIGKNAYDSHPYLWNGHICNMGIWSKTLSQAEIKSIMWKNYAGLTDTEKTSLVSWWNLDTPITEDYNALGEGDDSPSTIDGLVLDNHDTTFTEVSVTNSDFTSGSGTSITGWTNTAANKWEISGSTMTSPNGISLISQDVLTDDIAHKLVVRAKNTIPGSTARLSAYFGANNFAIHNLTDDFQEYTFHGYQDNDTTLFLYNPTGASSTNVTIDWVKLYKYDGNVGVLV